MIEKEILQALQTATISAVAASTVPTLPVKFAGRVMPDNAGNWLELVYLPNNITAEFWDDGKTYRGVFRLILHWSVDDRGSYEPLSLIASICQHFPVGTVFQNGSVQVKITAEPDLSSVIEATPSQLFPVSIRYQTFRS